MNSKNSELKTKTIGFQKIIQAIRNCDEAVQDQVLEEYRKL